MATTGYEHDADGEGSKFIPATQRPDGTWRKPRRIRDGYVPQEEVPLYESKGKQFKSRQTTGLPVGLTPEIVAEAKKSKKGTIQPIPGLILNVEKKKKKKKTAVEDAADKLSKCEITEPTFSSPAPAPTANSAQLDPVKRLKNLKKKLRDIEALEEKITSGSLKNPDKEQKEKISRKNEILKEIQLLEKTIE